MGATAHLDWPFFEAPHRDLAMRVKAWTTEQLADGPEPADVDAESKRLVEALGGAGWLKYCVPADYGGALPELDTRSICIIREALAYRSGLADSSFALQGLGSGAISLAGSEALRRDYLPRVAAGSAIAAFALSEPDAGSDVGAVAATARRDGEDAYTIDGVKTWITNGGIAHFYVVFARTGEAAGSRGLSAFVVDADTQGLTVDAKIDVIAPHPIATMRLRGCRVPAAQRVGDEGEGFKIAMRTLDIFRPSVAAAALGFARRALDEAMMRALERRMFGEILADFQLTQAAVGDMAAALDASALLTYRAAWLRDTQKGRITKEAAMAKMFSTEAAQKIIDRAVQVFGGLGVTRGTPVERLYREIRALRIYEGATEVQQLIVGRQMLNDYAAEHRR
jgi:acyl-CoA dehydrogenase